MTLSFVIERLLAWQVLGVLDAGRWLTLRDKPHTYRNFMQLVSLSNSLRFALCYTSCGISMKHSLCAAALLLGTVALTIPPATQVSYTPYSDAKPILEAMAEVLPAELRDSPAGVQEESWSLWTKKRDTDIRQRLAQGDADSVVNFLMFGTSFTTAPRLTSAQLHSISAGADKDDKNASAEWQKLFEKRGQDLIRGMMAPGQNERLQFARRTLKRAGIEFTSPADQKRASAYLFENALRVTREQASFREALEAARSLNDPTEEFAERSKLYKNRGLSLDTSLPPDYALELALKEMKKRGLLQPGSVSFGPEPENSGTCRAGKASRGKRARLRDSTSKGSGTRMESGAGGLLEEFWRSNRNVGNACSSACSSERN